MEEITDREMRGRRAAGNGTSGSLLVARPAVMLRAEGAAMLAGSVLLYWANGGSWWLFVLLSLAPDVSMVGYLAGPRVGAALYNAFHSYPLPAALGIFGLLAVSPFAVAVALVWFAHIGMDRLVGYGLKYPTGFEDTHLQRV
ncbi:hypothetical protein AVDCRST_MAG82-2343 [uncultured Rubrobacteraceae bacterium]|uniref:DUF4260 family protein n=1 Tax=uncultured Rubrobacteraceae bacterium TaxID=349277 RepID=A0A6J4Q558_9ACTN|nr:hypothetical protein AVDCRST_MAG82-2343 [uncultured Rubrobacteraceae bacterium]